MATPGTSKWREENWPSCNKVVGTKIEDWMPGIDLWVATPAVPAFHALADCFKRHNYHVRKAGVYNCRKITGGSVLSSHAFAIAIDVNWDTNPYTNKLVTDMPEAMTDEIQNIRTIEGDRVWRWGGDWDNRPETPHRNYDAMHFEIIATPAQLKAGINRVFVVLPAGQLPTLRVGAEGDAVAQLQERLGLEVSRHFDVLVDDVVRGYQCTRGLKVDGVVGPATWTAILHRLPALEADAIPPGKGR